MLGKRIERKDQARAVPGLCSCPSIRLRRLPQTSVQIAQRIKCDVNGVEKSWEYIMGNYLSGLISVGYSCGVWAIINLARLSASLNAPNTSFCPATSSSPS
jgi:hypothetical protein